VIIISALGAILGCGSQMGSSSTPAGTDVAGEWQSGGSVYRITTSGAQVKAVFEAVSADGQALGFKKGDVSFEGVRKGNFIQGDQVIRYPASNPCYRDSGRRVPFMAIISADGQRIVVDWYNLPVSPQTCQDVDRALGVTLLARRSG
jgi:hypothetical protein